MVSRLSLRKIKLAHVDSPQQIHSLNSYAAPLYADGRLYLCSHEGRTMVLATGDKFCQLAENDLDGQLMASPVVVGNDLLLRTESHLYRIGRVMSFYQSVLLTQQSFLGAEKNPSLTAGAEGDS